MARIQLLQLPQFNCSSLGPRCWTYSSPGPRQRSIGFAFPLQIRRINFLCCAGGKTDNGNNFSPPEDISYVLKLASGCIAGGIVIKYGSIFLPGITRPSLVQALFMIGIPVLTSILLLLWESGMKKPQSWWSFLEKYGWVQNNPGHWGFLVYFYWSFLFIVHCWKDSLFWQKYNNVIL